MCWLALVGFAAVLLPAGARADGDPGSDELQAQNLYVGADSGINVAQQVSLSRLLMATKVAGGPVRVAIISHRDDLGADTYFWGESPRAYASFLGTELSEVYLGRLLIVTPGGYGVHWQGHPISAALGPLSRLPVPGSSRPAALVAAAVVAIRALDEATGVPAGKLRGAIATLSGTSDAAGPAVSNTAGSDSAVPRLATPNGSGHSPPWEVLGLCAIAVALFVVWRSRRELVPGLRRVAPASQGGAVRRGLIFGVIGVAGLAVLAIVTHGSGHAGQLAASAQSNANLDPGTTLTPLREAPDFKLVDESGQRVSLAQYRGKVVILSFIDDECQTICPLTTTAMLDAQRSLGAAGKDVVLLGVDANWRSTQIADVLNYTDFHGMGGHWHFLTGSLPQLNRVWSAYHLNELALIEKKHGNTNVIDHLIQTYVIDPQGRLRTSYLTNNAYSAVPQLGQLFAQDAARLLPSHPKVMTDYSYTEVPTLTPTSPVTLSRVGGGTVTLGPRHPHVYVFFDTWDQQTTPIQSELGQLNAYARMARRDGLPTPVAVDEASVEPSAQALPRFLRTLRHPLNYPVAIDRSGQVADGYGVQGEPWFVITARSGQIAWYREIYTSTWPTTATLTQEGRAALSSAGTSTLDAATTRRAFSGSPAPLAQLHSEAGAALDGSTAALLARIRALRGYPVVVNVWYSTCPPCQRESGLLANAAITYGRRVAFIGADVQDSRSSASRFMRQHDQSYPTYLTPSFSLTSLIAGGIEQTPTTIFINPAGRISSNQGAYDRQSVLNSDIQTYALSR